MNPRRSFTRKIIYLAGIVGLLVPMYWLSRPAVTAADGSREGGLLAELRQRHHLAQSSLGEVDPASETMKLACLGLRGVAAQVLWFKAEKFKMKKDWANLSAALEQIVKIEPNFTHVWEHQAHNLAFNCSVEFDDWRQRYQWVIRGMEFLGKGIKINLRAPRLQWYDAFIVCFKIGRSDEKKQYRRRFVQDNDFHGDRPMDQRDNWLVGYAWYRKAEDVVDHLGAKMTGLAPLIFRSHAPIALYHYAMALEEEGTFGEVAQRAWRTAGASWEQYGGVDIPTSWERTVNLRDTEMLQAKDKQLQAKLDGLAPGWREKLRQEKINRRSAEQLRALNTPLEKRTSAQHNLVLKAEEEAKVTHAEVAAKAPPAQRKEAEALVDQLTDIEENIRIIAAERPIVNYEYWRLRAQFEQEEDALQGHALTYAGDVAYADAKLAPAKAAYEKGFAHWRKVLDRHPALVDDKITTDDLLDAVKKYKAILAQMDLKLPENFILADVIKARPDRQQ